MTAIKTTNFSAAAEAIILAAVRANGNVASQELAETLRTAEGMRDNDGNIREVKSIVAKMSRMKEAHDFTYARKVAVSKNGDAVQKKMDLVNRIAAAASVTASQLDGLDKAPKGTLQTLAAIADRLAEYEAA